VSAEFPVFMKNLCTELLEVANKACGENLTLTAPQFKQLLRLALVGARATQKTNASDIQEIWQPNSWHALSESLETSPRYKQSRGLREMSEQIVRLSRTSESTDKVTAETKKGTGKAIKRKADNPPEVEQSVASKKMKRKKAPSNTS